jgi:hypothetical protein
MQQLGRTVRAFVFVGGWALLLGMWSCGGGGGGGGGGAVLPIATVGTSPPPSDAPVAPPPDAPVAPPPAAPPAPEVPVEPPAATSRVISDTIVSAKTGATYPIDIYLPASYDGGSPASYPVIYAMDGDAVFNPPGTRFSNFKDILDTRRTQAILVGIGGSSRREEDYALPGARAYHDFLTLELVPFIEARYRADVTKRLLTGLSLSGSMAGIALFLEGAAGNLTFSHFLSFEGAYDYQGAEYDDLEQQMHDALGGRPLPATLILTRCDHPVECNAGPVSSIFQRLVGRVYQGLTVEETTYSTSHTGTDIPSFTDTIAKVLP